MGQVSASSAVLIDAEPETVLAAVADYQARVRQDPPRTAATTGCSRRAGCRHRGDVEAACHQIAGARRQDERRRGRAHSYRQGRQLDDGDQLDRRGAGAGSSVTVKTSRRGAGGIGGFFEKTFAPLGLRKTQGEVLENLKKEVEGR
jgi:hypothetical protein